MNCPKCKSLSSKETWRKRYSRCGKSTMINSLCWQCNNCRFRFIDATLENENEFNAAEEWLAKFKEPLPPPVVGERIRKIMQTAEGRERVGKAFGIVLERVINSKQESK